MHNFLLFYYACIIKFYIFDNMDKNKSIDHQLRATWQAVAKMYNEQAANYGSTMSSAFVLLTIDKVKGTPSTALGPLMGMEPTSLSRILKSMESKGAISREKNPEDGRSVIIKLTDYGKEIWALFESGKLQHDTPLTGRFKRSTVDADVDSVMQVIDDAREQEDERRERELAARETE